MMKNYFWVLIIGLVLLVVVFVVGLGFYCGPIVKIAVEQIGPKVAHVPVKVDDVAVSLLTGSVQVKGLIVGNPSGFKSPQAISVGTIAVSMDTFSIFTNKIIVRSIHVESPEITYERGLGTSNLSKIMSNESPDAKSEAPASAADNKSSRNVEVDDFLITGAKVHVILPGLGSKDVLLPDIHLTDLGKGSNGLTPAQLTSVMLKAIIVNTVNTITNSAINLGQGVQTIGKITVSAITNSIGSLFGK